MKKELLKMYATNVKSRNLYQKALPKSRFEDKSEIKIVISRNLHKDIIVSVERMSQEVVTTVLNGITKKEERYER